MRTIVAPMALVLAASVANAAPVNVVCTGTTTDHVLGKRWSLEETLSVSMDFGSRVVTVAWAKDVWRAPIASSPNDDVVTLAGSNEGLKKGRINRITGEASFTLALPSLNYVGIFGGTCKPAQKLF